MGKLTDIEGNEVEIPARARIKCPTGLSNDIEVEVLCTDGEYHQISYMTKVEFIAEANEAVKVVVHTILAELEWEGDITLVDSGCPE